MHSDHLEQSYVWIYWTRIIHERNNEFGHVKRMREEFQIGRVEESGEEGRMVNSDLFLEFLWKRREMWHLNHKKVKWLEKELLREFFKVWKAVGKYEARLIIYFYEKLLWRGFHCCSKLLQGAYKAQIFIFGLEIPTDSEKVNVLSSTIELKAIC